MTTERDIVTGRTAMALSDYERSLLIDTSMQLMQQSLLSDYLFQAGQIGRAHV